MLPIYSRAVALFETKAEEFALQVVLLCDEEEEGFANPVTRDWTFLLIFLLIFFSYGNLTSGFTQLKIQDRQGKDQENKVGEKISPKDLPHPSAPQLCHFLGGSMTPAQLLHMQGGFRAAAVYGQCIKVNWPWFQFILKLQAVNQSS